LYKTNWANNNVLWLKLTMYGQVTLHYMEERNVHI